MQKTENVINLTQLVHAVAEKTTITKDDSALMVKAVLGTLREEILKGNKIAIKGFGTFSTKLVGERTAPNPQVKGATVIVPPHYKVVFKPAMTLRAELKAQKPTAEELAELAQ